MFSKEELTEIKVALNTIIGSRHQYKLLVKENSIRAKDNEKYLQQDYKILEKVIKAIDDLKIEELEQC